MSQTELAHENRSKPAALSSYDLTHAQTVYSNPSSSSFTHTSLKIHVGIMLTVRGVWGGGRETRHTLVKLIPDENSDLLSLHTNKNNGFQLKVRITDLSNLTGQQFSTDSPVSARNNPR